VHPALTTAHLAQHSFVTGQSMADMATALMDRGWLERHRDLSDRRRLVSALSASGRTSAAYPDATPERPVNR
jgi:DNA-binding MarR family transcriptional regulator